jgi:hypothetical protein
MLKKQKINKDLIQLNKLKKGIQKYTQAMTASKIK